MAKETTIIFVYDTELLKREEDDPNSAILYFYPTWVSDQQKTALCGQLMGTIRCLKSVFSMPKVVSLQTGKFFIVENDQFILAIGSDRNIPDWVLDHRANLFYSLINFFHKDFVNLSLLYQKAALSAKLYYIFDTYIKLMMFGGNIFSQVPMLEMPKSGSTVFMETVAFLDRCRDFPNALGGTILYHNKVVATHLSASTTKKIVFADPYRIKNPAEIVETNFELPFGVQLLHVYITNKEFCVLHESAFKSRCILQHLYNKKCKRISWEPEKEDLDSSSTSASHSRDYSGEIPLQKNISYEDEHIQNSTSMSSPEASSNKASKITILQNITDESSQSDETQEPSTSVLKRNTSLLFTSVTEEDGDHLAHPSVTYRQNSQRRSRPNSLILKSHNFDLNESKLNSKITPVSSYCSQSSVASTPMTESKIFLHQEPLNCFNKEKLSSEDFEEPPLDQNKDLNLTLEENCSKNASNGCPQHNLSQEITENQSITSDLPRLSGKEGLVHESQPHIITDSEESKSINTFPFELTKAFYQSMHQNKPFRRSCSLVSLSEVLNSISKNSDQYLRLKSKLSLPKRSRKLKRSNSIHDPCYPSFKQDDSVPSQYYFKDTSQYDFLAGNLILHGENGRIYPKSFVNIITKTEMKKDEEVKSDLNQVMCPEIRKIHRKSLTLPLKPLNSTEAHRIERKYSIGVQLTPLMNKLTILASEEQTKSGKISISHNLYGATPSKETSDLSAKCKTDENLKKQEDNTLRRCVLFVCGQQDVVLGLLLQEDCSKDRESIEKLWDLCTEQLPKFEKQINYCLQSAQSKDVPHNTEPYSFLSINSEWDTVKRGGPWDNEDLSNVSRLYGDFKSHGDISDIFLRNPESVIYGHHFGSSQVFYHESAPVTNGLVLPSDAIGQVHHKARKNLERDHNIVLP